MSYDPITFLKIAAVTGKIDVRNWQSAESKRLVTPPVLPLFKGRDAKMLHWWYLRFGF